MQVSVRVATGAKREGVEVLSPTHLKILAKEKPEHNTANRRVVELAARYFKISAKKVRIIRGHHSSSKILSVG